MVVRAAGASPLARLPRPHAAPTPERNLARMLHTLYEINSAVWLGEQPWVNRSAPDLADLPEERIREWVARGIEAVWFLGVWRRGAASRAICQNSPDLRRGFEESVPGAPADCIMGSPFSIVAYEIDPALGRADTLARLREKLNAQGIRLILDFVSNHLAVDHPWVESHPERFVPGSEVELSSDPSNYFSPPGRPDLILGHGRDPYFPGWTDTAQVNIFNPGARQALIELLTQVSGQCDGVRCDMAMLLLNDVFRNTWGDLSLMDYPAGPPPEFWAEAVAAVRKRHPKFVFIAEVYWNLERRLLDLGFDFTYDKTLYDLARTGDGTAMRKRLEAVRESEQHFVRFLENHDETRAAKSFGPRQRAVATIVASVPGLHLYHEGQFEGRRVHVPVQLCRRAAEPADPALAAFYARLLGAVREPVLREGKGWPLRLHSAWPGNTSEEVIVAYWRTLGAEHRLAVANIGDHQAQAYAEVPLEGLDAAVIELRDLLSETCYYRTREHLAEKGMYLDLTPGEHHIFRVLPAPAGVEADD